MKQEKYLELVKKDTVWSALATDHAIGPFYFYEWIVTGNSYHHLLKTYPLRVKMDALLGNIFSKMAPCLIIAQEWEKHWTANCQILGLEVEERLFGQLVALTSPLLTCYSEICKKRMQE